jgi:hypothetical protein
LLPEYRDEEDDLDEEGLDEEDDYYNDDFEYEIEIDDSKFYK